MAARLRSLKVFLLLSLQLQIFIAGAVKRSCSNRSDCNLGVACCNGVCTNRSNCDGSCQEDSDCDRSLDENCCEGNCKVSGCTDKPDLVIGLSVAAAVLLFALIGVGICCVYRSRPAPGRIVNRRNTRTATRTRPRRGLGTPKQQYPRYPNTGSVNHGYEEFPQSPCYSSGGYQPTSDRGNQHSIVDRYQPSGCGWQSPQAGRFQPSTTTAFSREEYQNNFNEGAGIGPPPPYVEVGGSNNANLYTPQKSYGTATVHTQPSAQPS